MGVVEVRALEHPRELAQEVALARLARAHHVEQPVVERGVGREVHAAAVGLRVGGGDAPAAVAVRLAVELELEGRRPPGHERAQRAVGVDEVAERGRRLLAIRLASESKPQLAMPTNARPSTSPRSSAPLDAVADDRARRRRVAAGRSSTRARSLPRPPGSTASSAVGPAQRARDPADQPVAAQRRDHLAAPDASRASSSACSRLPWPCCVLSIRSASQCVLDRREASAARGRRPRRGCRCSATRVRVAHRAQPCSRMNASTASGRSVTT